MRTLILGGTTEGRRLATALDGHGLISSLAGRTSSPRLPPGEVRIGGFGGVSGLVAYLRKHDISAIVDATHPFAATMTAHATAASAETGIPLLVLRRPGWSGGDWLRVRDLPAAAALVPQLGSRVFLTTGRQSVAAFAPVNACWFLSRSVEEPSPPVPQRCEVVLDRGPFTVDGERELLRRHRIDVLVTKDSGGPAPKLEACRELGVPVVMVDRPPLPSGVSTAETVAQAIAWLEVTRDGTTAPS